LRAHARLLREPAEPPPNWSERGESVRLSIGQSMPPILSHGVLSQSGRPNGWTCVRWGNEAYTQIRFRDPANMTLSSISGSNERGWAWEVWPLVGKQIAKSVADPIKGKRLASGISTKAISAILITELVVRDYVASIRLTTVATSRTARTQAS
jgi:hypothetical protein